MATELESPWKAFIVVVNKEKGGNEIGTIPKSFLPYVIMC